MNTTTIDGAMKPALRSVFAVLAALLCSLPLAAQTQPPPKPAPSPAATATHPDFSGVWEMPREAYGQPRYDHTFSPQELPMTAWAKQRYDAAKPSEGPKMVPIAELNDPFYACLPPGIPRIYFHPFAMEIVQMPKEFIQLFEYDHLVRHVYTDGRQHGDPDPTFMGDAVGHWEGSALVVDSVAFNDRTWLDRVGHPHSDKLHVVERFQRTSSKLLQMDLTVEDPVAYTKPLTKQLVFRSEQDWKIQEHVCIDNAEFLEFDKRENGSSAEH
jgi:hypothetical protein